MNKRRWMTFVIGWAVVTSTIIGVLVWTFNGTPVGSVVNSIVGGGAIALLFVIALTILEPQQ